jgi:two-component system, response regulator YesN
VGGYTLARALLVDDEKYIRNGLRAMISRADSIFTDIDECVNGIEALQKLSQYRYDLVITDLNMPQIDGIQLVARIDSMDYKPYTVVLSGYDDFKYAQKAINFGVKAYLLKPINRNELLSIVKKAEAEFVKKQNIALRDIDNGKTEFYENQFKLMLLSDNTTKEESDKGFYNCDLDFVNEAYRISLINSSGIYECQNKRENNIAMLTNFKKYLADSNDSGYCFLDNRDNVVAILKVKISIDGLLETINKMYNCECTAGIGEHFHNINEMHVSFKQADYALKYKLLKPNTTIINYSDISGSDRKFIIPIRLIKKLAGMLDSERKDELCKTLHQIFDEDVIKKYHLEYLEKLSTILKDEIIQNLSEYIPQKIDFIQEQESNFKSIYQFNDLHDYIHYINKFIMNINDVLLKLKYICNTDKTIDMAVKYVQDNYRKDLSMAEVSNYISLNYSYFSILFKEKIGMNFIDYVRMVRIEKAKGLLQNSFYKIYEVSEMVGYSNTKHFTTTFRMLTGVSPSEFRAKLYINN